MPRRYRRHLLYRRCDKKIIGKPRVFCDRARGKSEANQWAPLNSIMKDDIRLGHKNRDINPFQYPASIGPKGGWSWHEVTG